MHTVKQLAHAAIGVESLRCTAHLVVATHQALMESLREFVCRDTATVKIERLLVSSVLLEPAGNGANQLQVARAKSLASCESPRRIVIVGK